MLLRSILLSLTPVLIDASSCPNDNWTNRSLTEFKLPVNESDVRFPSLTSGFNQRWYAQNCEYVYQVHSADEVVKAVNDIVDNYGGNVKIRSGGHCYENFVMSDETRGIIDVRGLVDYGHDKDRGYYLSSGDTNWGAFKKLFTTWGKILPSGSCYSVGLGGHISGGGDGIMSRKYGTTVDTLTGIEVVMKDKPNNASAYIKYVSEDSTGDDYDLYWALRGAGNGNFGVITKYYYKELPQAPKGAIISNVAFKWTDDFNAKVLKKILDWYVDFASKKWNHNSSAKFPIMHKAANESQMFIHTAYFDEDSKNSAKLYHRTIEKQLNNIYTISTPSVVLSSHAGYWSRPLNSLGMTTKKEALSDTTHDLPFYDATQTMNMSGPNQRGKYKSTYMKTYFPMRQVKAIIRHLKKVPKNLEMEDMKQSLVQIDTFGGKINSFTQEHAALGQRDYLVKLQFQTYWVDKKNDKSHLNWIRNFYHVGMYEPYGGVPDPAAHNGTMFQGCYYNYPDSDLNDYVGRDGALNLYFLENFEKNPRNLVKAKCRWDPENHFNFAQSIPVKKSAC